MRERQAMLGKAGQTFNRGSAGDAPIWGYTWSTPSYPQHGALHLHST